MSWRDNPEFLNTIAQKFRGTYARGLEVAKLYLPITTENIKKLILFNQKSWRKLKVFMRSLNTTCEEKDPQLRFKKVRGFIEFHKQEIDFLRDELAQEYFDF